MFQLVFEATMTGGYLGDIAIDDISVSDGRCGSDSVTPVSVHSNVTLERSAQLRRLQKFKKFRKMLRRRRNDDSDRSWNLVSSKTYIHKKNMKTEPV